MRILVLLIISFFSFSQEEQYRSEFAWCNLKDENSIDDAKNIASKYGEFVESVGSQYEQSFLAPMHAGNFNTIMFSGEVGQMGSPCMKSGDRT